MRDPSSEPQPRSRPSSERTPTPAELRGLSLLRGLVTVLTATMILGIVALVVLLYTRLPGGGQSAAPILPDALVLPEGETAQAITAGGGWWAVVTEGGHILLFDGEGALTRRIAAEELRGD